jgi:hypothetical protein
VLEGAHRRLRPAFADPPALGGDVGVFAAQISFLTAKLGLRLKNPVGILLQDFLPLLGEVLTPSL